MNKFELPLFRRNPEEITLGRIDSFSFAPEVRIGKELRATHMYVLGITGQGKSKLLEYLLYQDIRAGRGCGVLDPHTDLARDLLADLIADHYFDNPKNMERVIYFDPSRPEYALPFNVLASSDPPYVIAANLVEAFRRAWPESLREAPRFANILLAGILTLIANRRTLADLPRLLTNKEFREAMLVNISDPEIISVFHDRLDRWGKEQPIILESVLNKVSALTLNPILRASLGHQENRLDFRKIMDEGKVLIADLGKCDGETRRILGSLMVTGLEQAALSRKDRPPEERRPYYLYIDEFQDFAANDGSILTLTQVLSESRKFGLHMILAHQTLGQMKDTHMQSALGNIGTKVIFAVDRLDAEYMAKRIFSVSAGQTSAEQGGHGRTTTLPEEWESAVQILQHLKPRTALVKLPQRPVIKIHTVLLPKHSISQAELEQWQRRLVAKEQTPGEPAPPVVESRVPVGDYEPIPPVPTKRLRVTP
jgi:DNA helicase HerA-like ATPase